MASEQFVIEILDSLPDDCSVEDIQYEPYVRHTIQRGEDDGRDCGGQRLVMFDSGEPSPAPTRLRLIMNWSEELKRLVPTNN